jgi:fused signal recognition particle receptor
MLSFLKSGQKPGTGWAARLKEGLARTRKVLNTDLKDLFAGGAIDEAFFDELENTLLLADVGVSATEYLIGELRSTVRREGLRDRHELKCTLHDALLRLLKPIAVPLDVGSHKPFIIMLAGVNGAGKTTSIGKIAKYYQQQGKSILLAAGDTFRAAAVDQLAQWAERSGADIVRSTEGADPGSVVHDALGRAAARGIDIVLADTAGRRANSTNLLDELAKVRRVADREPGQVVETFMVLDATTGQNAVAQAREFLAAASVTGIVLTKLDGTARGGIVIAIERELGIPVKYVGVGEGVNDLIVFDPTAFVESLLDA